MIENLNSWAPERRSLNQCKSLTKVFSYNLAPHLVPWLPSSLKWWDHIELIEHSDLMQWMQCVDFYKFAICSVYLCETLQYIQCVDMCNISMHCLCKTLFNPSSPDSMLMHWSNNAKKFCFNKLFHRTAWSPNHWSTLLSKKFICCTSLSSCSWPKEC